MQTTVTLELPESFQIEQETFRKMSELNPELQLQINHKTLSISEKDWMAGGAEIGIVVCPHRKKYYLFDHSTTYTTYDFTTPFNHSSLAELYLDFDELLNEAFTQVAE